MDSPVQLIYTPDLFQMSSERPVWRLGEPVSPPLPVRLSPTDETATWRVMNLNYRTSKMSFGARFQTFPPAIGICLIIPCINLDMQVLTLPLNISDYRYKVYIHMVKGCINQETIYLP